MHRFGFGLDAWENPARSRAEAWWFAAYHPLSYAYRVVLTLSIALFVAQEYRAVGLALAAWSVGSALVMPGVQAVWHVLTAPRVASRRRRALAVSGVLVGGPLALLALLPLPHGTVAPGVIAAPDAARLAAPVEAVVDRVLTAPGDSVVAGAGLLRLTAPLTQSQLAVTEAQLDTARARLTAFEGAGQRDDAAIARAEIAYLTQARDKTRRELAQLDLTSAADGRFLARDAVLMPGRRLTEGMELGFLVADTARVTLRVVVPATRIDLVETAPPAVRVLIPGQGMVPRAATLVTLAPQATRDLEFPALAQGAGGPLVMDPTDDTGRRTALPFHLATVATDLPFAGQTVGGRVWVRFDHPPAPLLPRIWRAVRQTFLQRLAL